ncbi:MAG: Tim44 domain-containing protein [Syntrophobacteraceae bacterium]
MKRNPGACSIIVPLVLVVLAVFLFTESNGWARAGGGGLSGSRGGRSFSSPKMPSRLSPGVNSYGSPGARSYPGTIPQSRDVGLSRNPFMTGLAGGLAGGFLGNMLFGGTGHAAPGAAPRGGIGLLDLAILGVVLYLGWRFFKRRGAALFTGAGFSRHFEDDVRGPVQGAYGSGTEVEEGLQRFRQVDPGFSEDALKETFQDIFFRVQAAWMHRSLEGMYGMLAPEMVAYFGEQFAEMKRQGRINRLENIAVRRVEVTEVWQEEGRDYVTAMITANLLDYSEDERTGDVVGGDRLNPVKFQEFWTFCRDLGASGWQLVGINQPGEAPAHAVEHS